jgi:MFS family permease
MSALKMTSQECRAVFGLSSILGLRMLGLFMVLPVFSLYAQQLRGATPTLIGIAIGIYGLSQAIFQIPFGALSDRIGRKPVIILGLVIFSLGSMIAGLANSISLMIIGRALQGMGAVGSTLMAMIADLTREDQRTKAMAIAGMTIGFSFSLAMLIGPLLTKWLSVNCLFGIAAFLGFICIFLLKTSIPTPSLTRWHGDTEPDWRSFLNLMCNPTLAKLNLGICFLHAIFTASFVVIPISLKHFNGLPTNQQWEVYLPSLLTAFLFSLFCIGIAERKQIVKPLFLSSIAIIAAAEAILFIGPHQLSFTILGVCLFFTGFSLLEAFLPSLISRCAPAARKGSALGIYSCSQFLGIFIGGVLGGWLFGKFSFTGVYLLCLLLAVIWFIVAYTMQPPRYLVTQLWPLQLDQSEWDQLASQLNLIPGMVETSFVAEDNLAYLKMERGTLKHPDFIRLKEQLQSES